MAQPIQITGLNINLIQGTNPTATRTSDYSAHIHYGDWAQGVERSVVDLDFTVTILSQTLNNDGSVSASIESKYTNWHRTFKSAASPDEGLTIHVYDSQNRDHEVRTINDTIGGSSKNYADLTFTEHITIPPLGTVSCGIGRYWNDLSIQDDEWNGGFSFYNPNPPDYRPFAVLDNNGHWQSCNRSGGMDAIMLNDSWVEMRTLNGGVGTDNPPSVMRNDVWTNQYKIGENG